ncbi:type IV pilin protein [Halomonas sp.]|uniref:type IV pilin protein n=1 Tax=Halomonas sp. TaxID=1486246 RepID=UPI00298E8F72|nr:type IV pilin protein [Halomonas sp.]MDW7746178.1 type IV pilin protein [Halomonas sp.]
MTPTSTQSRPQGPSGSPRLSAGFTLIELLIAVAVIGILAAIAYPNYTKYVKEARVSDGQAKLMEIAGRLERCYTVTSDYTKTGDGSACVTFDVPSEEGFYSISPYASGAVSTSAFKIKATGSSDEVACTELWVEQTGQRGSTPDGCW